MLLRPEAGFSEVEVITPAKQTLKLPRGPRSEVLFSDAESVGIYHYRVDPAKDAKQTARAFAVNLLDVNESNIEPRKAIRIGNERVVAGEEKFQVARDLEVDVAAGGGALDRGVVRVSSADRGVSGPGFAFGHDCCCVKTGSFGQLSSCEHGNSGHAVRHRGD